MRITCPNCDAQYEVDDRAIPDSGRDVQCSNCGHAWFQLPAHVEAAAEAEEEAFHEAQPGPTAPDSDDSPDGPADRAEPATDDDLAAESSSESRFDEEDDVEEAGDATDDAAAAVAPEWSVPAPTDAYDDEDDDDLSALPPLPHVAPGPAPASEEVAGRMTPAPQRRSLDDHVQSVLREEAARERKAREAEGYVSSPGATGAPSEQPPEEAAGIAEQAAATAAVAGVEDEQEQHSATRRDLLPDIEQINSTLRAESDATEQGAAAVAMAPPPKQRDRRSGFRLGFRLVLLLVIVVLILYVLAPSIASRYPPLAPAMNTLVTTINGYRSWLDRQLLSAVAGMNGN